MKLLMGISGVLLFATFSFRNPETVHALADIAVPPADTLRVENMVFSDFFSPNGDGVNDVFFIQGVDQYPENSFRVFNRWGQAVYAAAPYNNEWDGTNNQPGVIGNKELSDGVYYFELKSGTGYTAYGKITLKR